MNLIQRETRKDYVAEAVANAEAHLNNVGLPSYNTVLVALEQIERLSREADRNAVDVPTMLGDIARKALGAN